VFLFLCHRLWLASCGSTGLCLCLCLWWFWLWAVVRLHIHSTVRCALLIKTQAIAVVCGAIVVHWDTGHRESMWTFCNEVQTPEFYVPAGLLRVTDLSSSMTTTHVERSIGARTRSRCAVDVAGDGSADAQEVRFQEGDLASLQTWPRLPLPAGSSKCSSRCGSRSRRRQGGGALAGGVLFELPTSQIRSSSRW
jgi:hypothetical protein